MSGLFGNGNDFGVDPHGDDPHDFWAEMPTRPLDRITSRRKRTTQRKAGARQYGNTQQVPVIDPDGVIILDDTACRPFDGDTGLGGKSFGADFASHSSYRGESNPLLRRVGAMMVLLALGLPVAMALRGGDSGRTALSAADAQAIAAAEATVATEASVLSAAEVADAAGEVEVTLAGSATETVAVVVAQAPAETAAPDSASPAVVAAPVVQPVVAAPACVKTYTVALGDGWLLIANKHSVGMDELLASNAASISTFLMVGATICVPANASTPTTDPPATTPPATTPKAVYVAPFSLACAKTYVVVLGDGWLRIANKHSVKMKEVLAANAANASTFLMVGRKICVPANATTPTVAPTTTVKKTKTPRPPPTPTLYPPARTYTPAEVEAIIREVWPDELEEEALRIAKRESRLNPRAQNYCCYGLFQIYYNVHKKWLAEMGVTSGEQLLDPVVAAKAGLKLYQRNGWGPWKL